MNTFVHLNVAVFLVHKNLRGCNTSGRFKN
jgi:hypothetical protein